MKRKKRWLRPAVFAGLFLAALLLNHRFGWAAYLSGPGRLASLQALVRSNLPAAAAIYCGVTVTGCVLLALPGVTFAVLAGVIFGPVLGTLLCSAATTLGAGLAFFAGRFFLRDSLRPAVMKNRYLKKWLFDETGRNDVLVLMVTRLVPLFPYNLQNFAYGITDIPFRRYLFWSCVFMFPGTAAYTVGGAGLADPAHRGVFFAAAALLLAALVLLGRFFSRRYVSGPSEEPLPESGCTACGACMASCEFLGRRGLDFSDPASLSALADHCFLCGACTEVCPAGVDGRAYLLELRRRRVRQGGRPSGSLAVRLEKQRYLFRSYRLAGTKSVLFPGCSYPSFYPQTTRRLVRLMARHGVGTVFDCCGKPIAEMGLAQQEEQLLARLRERLRSCGTEELVTVCPYCYAYLKEHLDIPVVTVYDKLRELGLGAPVPADRLTVFRPCPDRAEGRWLKAMAPFLPETVTSLRGVQCCGLGGGAAAKEPAAAKAMTEAVRSGLNGEPLFVYCASCAGRFARSGLEPRHLLGEILGSDERPDTRHSVLNRARFKWYGGKEP